MFWRSRDNLVAQYAALVSDLRDQVQDRDEQIGKLVDRVIALSSPASLREAKRPEAPLQSQSPPPQSGRRRVHWPGYTPDTRPPDPDAPRPLAPASPLTDAEKVVVAATVGVPPTGTEDG